MSDFVGLTNLCPPAMLYLVLSLTAIVVMASQNYGTNDRYCIGLWSCPNSNTTGIFAVKLLFIFFFTWLLNVFCYRVSPVVSWALVMIPILMMFVGIALSVSQHIDWARTPTQIFSVFRS